MPEDTLPQEPDAGTAPAEGEPAGQPTRERVGQPTRAADVDPEARTFTQDDVDRIVTERLRRERQRTEKAVRDEFEGRLAELEASREEARQARSDAETLSGALRAAERRALVAERLHAKGANLPPPYLGLVDGDDAQAVDASIEAAQEQWATDLRRFARPKTDVGTPIRAGAGAPAPVARVDEALAERMRRGEADAFREYRALRR